MVSIKYSHSFNLPWTLQGSEFGTTLFNLSLLRQEKLVEKVEKVANLAAERHQRKLPNQDLLEQDFR